ncbi:MAG: TrmH family RNA methyltransferase, partial [Terriglobales bacterium]
EQHGPKLLPQLSKRPAVKVAEEPAFAAAMDSEHPHGVAALVQFTPARLEQAFGPEPALVLVAAGLQDPGNLGTLLRAADAFGATGLVALTDTVSPFKPKAVRASAGSLFRLPVAAPVAAAELIAAARKQGLRLLATAARGGNWDEGAGLLAQPCCLLIGQEGSGLPRELLRAADATLAIPVTRAVESLNAAMAGAILLFEASRQRQKKGHQPKPVPAKDPSMQG